MSPITSNATEHTGASEAPDVHAAPPQADAAVAQFEGMLFAGVLKPLSDELGVLGDVLTDSIATSVARGTHDAFYEHLRSLADGHGSTTGDSS